MEDSSGAGGVNFHLAPGGEMGWATFGWEKPLPAVELGPLRENGALPQQPQ